MNRKRVLIMLNVMVLVILAASVAEVALGGDDGAAKKPVWRTSGDRVTVTADRAALTAGAGERVTFTIDLDIADKWHIYAHGDSNYIGVDLIPADGFPLTDLHVVYPEGHLGEFFGEKIRMIAGQESLEVTGLVPTDLAAGEHALDMAVTVQACDDKVCLPPADLPVSVKLTVK